MLDRISKNLSLLVVVAFAVVALIYIKNTARYEQEPGFAIYDMAGYYGYMPAFWINGDYDFDFLATRPNQSFAVDYAKEPDQSVVVNKYSVGPALLLSPFFGAGHFQAYCLGEEQDGFSSSYKLWMYFGAAFYAWLSLLIVRRLLLYHFEDKVVASVLFVFIFATPLWHYTVEQPLMSHVYSFFLFSWAMWLSQQWLKMGYWKYLCCLALSAGLIAVTRLPNMVFFMVLVFWGVHNMATLKERLIWLLNHWQQVIVGLLIFLLPFIPQVVYWYHQTGSYYVNAYAENGEDLYWFQPMLAEVLIGYRKGWFIYTPVFLLSMLGFYCLWQSPSKKQFPILFSYLCINIYVVSCWGCWWYGGSFGMRALIECSIVLAYPTAAFFQKVYASNKWIISTVCTLVLCCTILNQIQSLQYAYQILHHDAMSRKAYWTIFCKLPPVSEDVMQQRDEYLIKSNHWEESRRKMYQQSIW